MEAQSPVNARRALWVILRESLRMVFTLTCGVRVFGRENVPAKGGVLLASNHQSYLDPMLAALALERSISFMARKTLFRNMWFAWLIRSLNAFPVDTTGHDVSALREAVARLRDGWCLLVFLEGTRTRDGSIGPLRPGALAAADRTDAAIVPVVIDGAFEAWPKNRWIRPHKIRIAYGSPLTAAEREKMTREEALAHIRNEMLRLQRALRSKK